MILGNTDLLGWISPRAAVQKYVFAAAEAEQNNYKK